MSSCKTCGATHNRINAVGSPMDFCSEECRLKDLHTPSPHWDNSEKGIMKLKEGYELKEDSSGLPRVVDIKEEKLKEEEELRNQLMSKFILDDDNQAELIDHAVGSITLNGCKLRYFGVKVSQKITEVDKKGNPYFTIQEVPAIITENRLIISKYAVPEGCNFKYNTIMTLKNNRWGDFKELLQSDKDVSYKEAYELFKMIYNQNMVFENPLDYEFCPLWDLATYHHDLIDKSLFIKREAPTGGGKSKAMKISSNLSFNGRKWLKPTPANFFRYRNCNKSTIYIEEAEKLFDDKNKNSSDNELVEYLNGSYEKGNFVPRQNDKDVNKTDEFDPFGFTQIGSIKPLKGALEKRSITIMQVKARVDDIKGISEIPSEHDNLYVLARKQAYVSSLLHYKDFLKAMNNITNDYNLSNREWLVSKPLIALAFCIDLYLSERIGKYLFNKFSSRDVGAVDELSWKYILAETLIKITCQSKEEIFTSNESLRMVFAENPNIGEYTKISPKAITTLMKELGFESSRNTLGDKRGFYLSFVKVCDIVFRNQNLTIQEIKNKVSEVSNRQFIDEDIDKICSDTYLTDKGNIKKASEISDTSD